MSSTSTKGSVPNISSCLMWASMVFQTLALYSCSAGLKERGLKD